MKKLFAILLAVAMIMSFALTASAEETEPVEMKAYLQYLSADYTVGNFSTPSAEISTPVVVNGDGTYTISWNMYEDYVGTGIFMLYIEFMMPYNNFVNGGYKVSNVKLTVDGKEIALDQSKLSTWADSMDTENKNCFCVELYVPLSGFDAPMSDADAAAFVCSENMTVTFDFDDPADVEEPTVSTSGSSDATGSTSKPDDSNAKTGDSISIFVALMAVSALGIVAVSKKKFN